MSRSPLLAACAMLLLATTALADTVTKHDGTRLTGTIIAEDNDIVTVQSNIGELTTRTKIARKDIASINRDAKSEFTYCRIPIEGDIGGSVKAQWLEKAIDQARSLKATHIILYINSPGGYVDEMNKIIDVIKKNDDLHFVAHVKSGFSAAAMIAMACPTIVITPDGSIGAAVPFRTTPRGAPEVDAKLISAFSSIARAIAEYGGHPPMIARGMIEPDLVLTKITGKNGRPQIVEGEVSGGTSLKKRGEILTFQGKEALDAGLATAVSDNLVGSPSLAGVSSWASAGDGPWNYMKSRQNAVSDTIKDVEVLRAQIVASAAQAKQAKENADKLIELYKKDAQAIQEEYKIAASANRLPSEMNAALKAAEKNRDTKLALLKARYQALIDEQRRACEAATEKYISAKSKLQQALDELQPRP